MRALILILLSLVSFSGKAFSGGEVDMNYLREQYYYCVSSSEKTEKLYKQLVELQSDNAVITGFIGALEALKAKHAWNPYRKMAHLDKAAITLAKAVQAAPNNIEIRFLRYTLEYYVPSFLGYSKHLVEDKKLIINNIIQCRYAMTDRFLVENIIKFFDEHSECKASELVLMRQALKQCTPTY